VSLGWDTAPSCIQDHVPGTPYPNVYKPYEKCAACFTFAPGSKPGTFAGGVSNWYLGLTALGFVVMLAFLVWWVMLEDKKLRAQAAHLLTAGRAGQVQLRGDVPQPGTGGPA
jgi:hypothetical protein